jgi:hypothetical protein
VGVTKARRASLIAGVVLGVGALMTGCSSQHAGTAAIINGQRITETDLQNQVNAALTELSTTSSAAGSSTSGGTVAQDVLDFNIELDLLNRLAGRLGVTASSTEVAEVQASGVSSLGSLAKLTAYMTQAPDLLNPQGSTLVLPPTALQDYLYGYTLNEKLGSYQNLHPTVFQSAFNWALGGLDVTVNPRYGAFNVKTLTFTSGVTATAPWLRDGSLSG